MVENILQVVTGSKLHGLDNKYSDTDIRGIHMHSIKDILSPYRKIKNIQWIEGDVDNTSYELMEFCKMATQGNPNILEVLWSNQIIENSDAGLELQKNRHKFLDSKRIFDAHKGYAHNQYKKMNLFEPDKRTPKFCVAYIRTLQSGIGLLKKGDFSPQVTRNKDFLLEIKYNFDKVDVGKLGKMFEKLQIEFAETYYKNENNFTPDIEWIENFIYNRYKHNNI